MTRPFDVIVIGAGVHGLSAAWHLALAGKRVLVLERFAAGHARGSSHGTSRITRTSYHAPAFAEMAREALEQDWPRLERDADARIVHPCPGLFFGPRDGTVRDYVATASRPGSSVEPTPVAEARRRFPWFRLAGDTEVLTDRSAAVLAADTAMDALRRVASRAGAVIREGVRVTALAEDGADAVRVHAETARGEILEVSAGTAVVTAGAWVGRLLPALASRFTVARQTVCYVDPGGADADAFRPPRFPVWVWLGRAEHEHAYGLPEFGRPGLKAAFHDTGTGADDPEDEPPPADAAAVDRVLRFLAEEFTAPPRAVLATERCLYTNTADQDFVLGPLPGRPRIVVGAACSGHAFKFGPLLGRRLAGLAASRD